jgi:hypothetical protein
MFSQHGKNRKVSNVFKVIWVLYAIAASFFNFNLVFSLVNISVFLLVTGVIHCISKIYPKINASLSVLSILIYSLFVDIACYYALPSWANGQPLVQYIVNGFLFNYKYVILNATVLVAAILSSKILQKHKIKNFKVGKVLQ